MAQWVKVPVAKTDSLNVIPGHTEWKERINSCSCALTSRLCCSRRAYINKQMKNGN